VAKRTSGESEALDRLEADDVTLEKTLEEARSAARRAVAKARAAAEAESAAARAALEAEVGALLDAAARDVVLIDAAARTAAEARASEVGGRAQPRLDRAVDLVLRMVLGEAP
jgi:ribosomal protein S20